jgi:NAD(P)-dependent dehydrogenase (short-subunit alcohol dehydrogenase family)
MQQDLQGKVALVTGSARRVGKGIMLGFARAGAHVVIHHGASPDEAEAAADEARAFGVRAVVVQANLADRAQIAPAIEAAAAEFGRLDVLVNSASVFSSEDFLEMPAETWQEALDVNLSAPFYATQTAGRLMRARNIAGCIINIADNSGLRPWPARPQHSVSKAGLIMLTQVTAAALAGVQIRANCIVLGPTLPSPGMTEQDWGRIEARLPLQRSADVDDPARAAVFLATNDFITGAVLHVDGGEWLAPNSETA